MLSRSRPPLTLPEYERLFRIIHAVVENEGGDSSKACLFFGIAGAHLLSSHHRFKTARLVAGIAGVGSGDGVMFELDSVADTSAILHAGGWTVLTGINLMLFSLLHNPCSTTIYTIYKETKSIKWTVISSILPVMMGFAVCFFVTQVWRLIAS